MNRARVPWAVAVLLVLFVPCSLLACPICFQVEQSPTTDGLRAAVLVLIGVTTCVLAGCATFVVRMARRS
jgi:hypothetical protein